MIMTKYKLCHAMTCTCIYGVVRYTFICDQILENRLYVHIQYLEKYRFKELNSLWLSNSPV